MRAALDEKTGNLIPPATRPDGCARLEQLEREIARITTQLGDPARARLYPTASAYDAWKVGAGRARFLLEKEATYLRVWLDEHPEADLLRAAYDVFLGLLKQGVHLDPEARWLVTRIGHHLGARR